MSNNALDNLQKRPEVSIPIDAPLLAYPTAFLWPGPESAEVPPCIPVPETVPRGETSSTFPRLLSNNPQLRVASASLIAFPALSVSGSPSGADAYNPKSVTNPKTNHFKPFVPSFPEPKKDNERETYQQALQIPLRLLNPLPQSRKNSLRLLECSSLITPKSPSACLSTSSSSSSPPGKDIQEQPNQPHTCLTPTRYNQDPLIRTKQRDKDIPPDQVGIHYSPSPRPPQPQPRLLQPPNHYCVSSPTSQYSSAVSPFRGGRRLLL